MYIIKIIVKSLVKSKNYFENIKKDFWGKCI